MLQTSTSSKRTETSIHHIFILSKQSAAETYFF